MDTNKVSKQRHHWWCCMVQTPCWTHIHSITCCSSYDIWVPDTVPCRRPQHLLNQQKGTPQRRDPSWGIAHVPSLAWRPHWSTPTPSTPETQLWLLDRREPQAGQDVTVGRQTKGARRWCCGSCGHELVPHWSNRAFGNSALWWIRPWKPAILMGKSSTNGGCFIAKSIQQTVVTCTDMFDGRKWKKYWGKKIYLVAKQGNSGDVTINQWNLDCASFMTWVSPSFCLYCRPSILVCADL